jgi:poly(A) polymerase
MVLDPSEAQPLSRRLAQAFRSEGEELYLVGGAVRDALLHQVVPNLDFATSAVPAKTLAILEGLKLGTPYRVGERFGTIGLLVGDVLAEITTYRQEVYPSESRKPEVKFGRSLVDDLSRRDFTVNAIAQDPLTEELIDPLHGMTDLRNRLIRAVGDPSARFDEDPLRLLRAIRLASRLEFSIDPSTWEAVLDKGMRLETISRERVRDEYSRILTGPTPAAGLTLLRDANLFEHTVPQLLALTRMLDHGPRHPMSLWEHTMKVVDAVPPELVVRWAALLHDIAKPETRTHEPSGRPRFFHHEEVGAQIARDVLTGLRYSNQIVDEVVLLIETHMQPHSYSDNWSDGAVRRFMLRFGPLLDEAITLSRADAAGHSKNGVSQNGPKFERLEERIADLDQEGVRKLDSPLTGDDLMERYDRPPGQWIGEIKSALKERVLDGRLSQEDKAGAWAIADKLMKKRV